MKKIVIILIISILTTFFMVKDRQVANLYGADTTITIMDLDELLLPDTNDYLIVVDSSANITKRISANGAIVLFLKGKTIDSLAITKLMVNTLQGTVSPIIVLDTINVTGQVYATYLKGDSTYTPIIVLDTIKSNVDITGYFNITKDSLKIGGTAITSTASELNKLDGTDAITADFDKLHDVTSTANELNKCDGISATAYQIVMEMLTFTETTGAGTYTGVITVPANSLILDVIWKNDKLWNANTSATLNVGDTDDANGYFTNIDLKTEPAEATPTNPTGFSSFKSDASTKGGGYAGLLKYSTSAQVITATVVTVGTTGDTGRSYMFVTYSTPIAIEATKE